MNAFRSRQVGRVLGDRRLIADAVVSRRLGGARPGGGGVTASVANHAAICPQAHRPLSHRPLQPLNAYVVAFGAPAMHLGRDRPLLQHPRESQAGELAALSMLKIYGSPWRANASCTASMRNSLSTAGVSVQPADPPRPHPTTNGAKDRLAHSTTRRRLPTKPSPHADANEGID